MKFGTRLLCINMHFVMYKQFYYFHQWRPYWFCIKYFWGKKWYATAFFRNKNNFSKLYSFLNQFGLLIFFRPAHGLSLKKSNTLLCHLIFSNVKPMLFFQNKNYFLNILLIRKNDFFSFSGR